MSVFRIIGLYKFKIQDSRFKIPDSRFQIQDSRFKIQDSRFKIPDSRFQIQDSRFQIQDSRFKIPDSRFKIPDSRFQIPNNMKIERFEDLDIWKEARELCRLVFDITSSELFNRDFKLRDQIRASSGSIMDNVAEGFERGGNKEFIQFLSVAKGSCGEVRSQSYRAFDYKYIDQITLNELLDKTINLSKHISGFMSYLKNSDLKGPKYH